MRRLRGVKSLVHDAVDHTVDLVALGHESTARRTMSVLSRIPAVAEPARLVNLIRRYSTAGVLGTVKVVNRLVRDLSDAGLDAFTPASGPDAPIPLRSDAMGSAEWMADAALGMANGVFGDHLDDRGNPLDLGCALRSLDAWIGPGAEGIPATAGPRIVVLIHGLATTEWSWSLDAGRNLGDPAANFGTLLERDFGYTPLFVRYNSGRHVSENGRALADRLRELAAVWPHPVEEILLVGHSMGGLVLRSACHIGAERNDEWVGRVHRVVTLATPHQGARLERFGNVAARVLDAIDLPATAIPARLINGRSAGIKDLRYGYVHDGEWSGHDPDAMLQDHSQSIALPAHISWCFIAATLPESADHVMSRALGDLLVHAESASGPSGKPEQHTLHHVGGIDHARVLTNPTVYGFMHRFLTDGTALIP